MKNKIREYIDKKYSEEVLENYREDFGLNGWDRLLGCESEEEVDEILGDYI